MYGNRFTASYVHGSVTVHYSLVAAAEYLAYGSYMVKTVFGIDQLRMTLRIAGFLACISAIGPTLDHIHIHSGTAHNLSLESAAIDSSDTLT